MAALAQPSLFAAALSPSPVQGLTYASEAITLSDERDLAAFAEGLAFKPFEFRGFTGNRRTVSFGWRYDFNGGGFQAAAPMPDMVRELRARVAQFARIPAEDFVQCSIIEYAPGAGSAGTATERNSALSSAFPCSPLAGCDFVVSGGKAVGSAPPSNSRHARRMCSMERPGPCGSTAFQPWIRFAIR